MNDTYFTLHMNNFDVIIIGGSYAGLSAAMALGRSRRRVLIIDGGMPCNRQTPYSHNFITHDGEKPAIIAQKAKEQVLRYPGVQFLDDLAIEGRKTDRGFDILTQNGETYQAKKLIFATGIHDELPNIPGFAECWGITLIHCPYCHGYEFRDEPTAILANGPRAFHLATLVSNLTLQLTLITNGPADFTPEQWDKLKKHHIDVVENKVVDIEHENGFLRQLTLDTEKKMFFKAIYVSVPFSQSSNIPVSLGCQLTESGHIKIEMGQKTTVKGVYACGDNSSPLRSVANAVAAGNFAGAMANHELSEEGF